VKYTTIRLQLPRAARWFDRMQLHPAFVAAALIFILAGAISAIGRIANRPAPAVVPTPALQQAPMIIIQREHDNVPTPALPTPDQALRQEVDQLRQEVEQLRAQQAQPAPVVVEQPAAAPAPAELAAPTVDAEQYQVANDSKPGDFYTTPPVVSPAFQESLIDDAHPDALACGGSPMCGGLTNREARAALDAQRARQP